MHAPTPACAISSSLSRSRVMRAGARRGRKILGMRLKGENTGGELGFARLRDHPVDERAMAAVHAVEVSDRQRTPAPGALQRAVRDDHGRG